GLSAQDVWVATAGGAQQVNYAYGMHPEYGARYGATTLDGDGVFNEEFKALVKRFGPVKVIIGSQITSLPFFIELALGHYLWLAIAAFIMRNILMNLCQPVLKQFSQEVVHKDDQNAISVAFHSTRHGMFTVGNFAAGPLIIWGGSFSYVFSITIICYVIAIAVEIVMYPRMLRTAKGQ
ncbi:MAG: hypothetical protein L3J82_01430, partial [Planctomycetes bacterium]|nr:hypothetical protein [Planctomycetota bacterium]